MFVAAAKLGQWASRVRMLTRVIAELSHATGQIQVRGAFALMVSWVVLAEALGVEVILGAFLAGAIVSLSGRDHESSLYEKLDAIGYGFFIPLFFILVGVNFDLRVLLASGTALILVPLLLVAAYLVKVLPMLLYRTRFSWRETLGAGALLSSRLSLIIATSAIALQLGMITGATNAALVLVAVVTCTVSPILFARLFPGPEPAARQGVIVLGTDQLAVLVGGRLRQDGEQVTFIGTDETQLEHLRRTGFGVARGTPTDEQILEQAGATQAQALIAVSNAPEVVLAVCRLAQTRFQIPTVIARADDAGLAQQLQDLAVRVVQPAMATALALEGAFHFPAAFDMLLNKSDDVDVMDVSLRNPALDGRPLRQVRLPGNALVLGLRRQGDVMVPHGDTVLQYGDILMLVGSPDALRHGRRWLEGH
jgi:Trk K+ transport system NAD-binding subunit